MLWAAEAETAALLEAQLPQLREALGGAGLQPGAVILRQGAPPAPPQMASGHFVDART
jgi:flagellar hook-length control protein FliK